MEDRSFDDFNVEYAEAGERTADTNEVGEEVRRGHHREVFLSRTVYRDGSPVTMEEVLVIDEDDDTDDEPPDDDYGHEMWWRQFIRGDLRAIAGRWRGRSKLHAIKRYCVMCPKELEVKPRGRPPKTCSAACRKRLERALDLMSQNAPISRGTVRQARRRSSTPDEPPPPCTCAEIQRSGERGRCALDGRVFNPPPIPQL